MPASFNLRESYAFWTLVVLLAGAFLLGGSSREDASTLIVLRPLSMAALAVGLFGLTSGDARRFWPLLTGALFGVAIVAGHLVPLPPSVWTALPGRELAAEAARLGGSADVWRPLALVPWRGWNVLYALAAPVATLLLAIRCTDEQRRRLPVVILALIGASMLVAAVQVAGGYRSDLYIYRISSENVATGLFANRNHFAVILCCAFPILALVAVRARGGSGAGSIWLWLAGVAGAVALLVLMLTGSRAGMVLALLALASLPLIYQPARKGKALAQRRRYLVAAVVVLSLVLLVAIAVYLSRAEAIDRLLATNDKEEVRFHVWRPIAEMAGLYFPFGSGIGSFPDVFQVHEAHDLLKYTYLNHAHNDWLEYALETGLPGMILMLGGTVAWLAGAVRLLRMSPDREGGVHLGRAGAIAILLLGLASLVDYPLRVPSVACVAVIAAVWMATGLRGAKRGATRVVRWSEIAADGRRAGHSESEEHR